MVIQRDTTHSFNSAQVAWLEGRLYDLLDAADDARLHNGTRPSDETLPAFERAMLEACVLPIRGVLRLLGHDPATTDDSAVASAVATRSNRFHGVAITNLIAAGLLVPGTPLISMNRAWPAQATVVEAGIEYSGRVFATPSAAAAIVKEGGAVNGWDFWAAETDTGKITLATLRAHFQALRGQATNGQAGGTS